MNDTVLHPAVVALPIAPAPWRVNSFENVCDANGFKHVDVNATAINHEIQNMTRHWAEQPHCFRHVTPVVTDKSQEEARKAYFNLEMYVKNGRAGMGFDAQKFHIGAALNIMDKLGLNRLEQMIEVVEAIQKGGRV